MALFQINRSPDDRTLRQFAVAATVVATLAAATISRNLLTAGIVAAAGIVACAATWRQTQIWKPIFVGLSYATAPIGLVVGELLLLVMYFGVFLPIGMVMKLLGRDPLERRFDRTAPSYWTPKRSARSTASYFRQF
ncbi:MAG: hypothetical protein QM775_01450 [Pirellulales bacterium]